MLPLKSLLAKSWRKIHRCDEDVSCPANLFERQSTAVSDSFRTAQTVPDASTEQLGQDRYDEMAVHADPSTTFEVIPTEFFFGFTKACFDLPPVECDSK